MLIRTFLVEDKPEMRDTVLEAMEMIAPVKFVGYADSESAARRWLQNNSARWQLAIVDLFLAEGSGFGVLRDCLARQPSQKVVVLTSYKHPNITDRCLQLGADKVFDKSADLEELVDYCKAHAASMDDLTMPPDQTRMH